MTIGDWIARTAMLVLAALATLALVGSLASVSNSALSDVFPGEIAAPAELAATTDRAGNSAGDSVGDGAGSVSDPRVVEPGTGTMRIEKPVATPPPADREITRWLKALTYAVLALAAVAAAGVVALVRIGSRIPAR